MENNLFIDIIILLFLCAMTIELFIRSNLQGILIQIISIATNVKNIIIASKISDHWKEKVIPYYAVKLLINSLKILLIFSFVLFSIYIINLLTSTFLSTAISIKGIIISIIFSSFYTFLRQKII